MQQQEIQAANGLVNHYFPLTREYVRPLSALFTDKSCQGMGEGAVSIYQHIVSVGQSYK
jgi:hypothetical protein